MTDDGSIDCSPRTGSAPLMSVTRKPARRVRGAAGPALPRRPAARRDSVSAPDTLQARGLRSRDALKRAARDVLNEKGFLKLRVQDITERAGVAAGLFYRYFHDLREIVAEVAQDFFEVLLRNDGGAVEQREPYPWIFHKVHGAVQAFASNPGVLGCMFGFAGTYDEFDRVWKDNAHRWNLSVAEFLVRESGYTPARARSMGFLLGAMTEGVIYQALIRHTEDLVGLGRRPREIAELVAVLWYRAIYLADPPADQLSGAGRRILETTAKQTRAR